MIDLGYKFGKLTVEKQASKPENFKNNCRYWLCKCDCGNFRTLPTAEINRKKILSCGKCSKNIFDLSGSYGVGYTSKGEEFYFDKEDFDKIKNYTWSKTTSGYLIAYIKGSNNRYVYMHRLIVGLENCADYDVDHFNHNTCDNQKENLRICTHQNNIMNSKLSKNNKSGVTGVMFDSSINKWISQITFDFKTIYLGSFDDFDNAVKARKEAEEKYFGDYAYKKG